MGLLGSLAGLFAGNEDEDQAKKLLDQVNAEAGTSSFGDIRTDPAMRTSQVGSLNALRSIAQQGGLRPEDRVAQQQALDTSNRAEAGQRGAIFQGLAQRGMGGSVYELSQQLANEQGAAQRNSMVGAQTASDASKRALSAIGASGEMAGKVRGQDWGEAAQAAQAQDALAQFNAGQRLRKAGMQSGTYSDFNQRNNQKWQTFGNDIGDTAGKAFGII